jgi:hypothetical protein
VLVPARGSTCDFGLALAQATLTGSWEETVSTKQIAACSSVLFLVSISAVAQTGNKTPARQVHANAADTTTPMTLTGCLVKEEDYRRAHKLGSGALGGVGLGDEFVLVNAVSAPASSASASTPVSAAPSSAAAAPSSAEHCSETSGGTAYRLTGKLEDELKSFVGHRMEITGTFDHPRDARTAAGQTRAKLPPEIAISSYREAPISMAAAASPATTATSGTSPVEPRSQTPAPAAPTPAPQARSSLPKTASNEPMIALIGGILLSAAVALRELRRRTS